MAAPRLLRFGAFSLDTDRAGLVGPHGALTLRPKTFDVLLYLARHPRRLVSKDELIAAVWPNVFVTENSLVQCVREIRAALGDEGQQILKTVARRGYIFAAPVLDQPLPPEPPPGPSIAVLPFTNITGEPEQDRFADGLADDIITQLSRMGWLLVIARNSTFTYKDKPVPVKQVGRDLGVRYVLEGSVRKASGRIRVNAQLIDTATDAHLWADRYDGGLEDIFALQDKITESVVGALQPTLRSAEVARARRKRPDSLDAYDLVLRALPHVWSLRDADTKIAFGVLEQALRHEPDYPMALALASWCHGQRVVYQWSTDPDGDRAKATELAEAAQRLSPDDPLVLTVLATARSIVGEVRAADALLERALALDPNAAWAWNRRGWVHTYLGAPDAAIAAFERAVRLSPFDPLNPNCHFGRGGAHFVKHEYAQSAAWVEKGLQGQPNAAFMLRTLVPALWHAGRYDEARAAASRLLDAYPGITTARIRSALPYDPDTMSRMCEGLHLSGIPLA